LRRSWRAVCCTPSVKAPPGEMVWRATVALLAADLAVERA
jgi:hypothetical protein